MKKYEYKITKIYLEAPVRSREFRDGLDYLGDKGWELCCIEKEGFFIFKREIKEVGETPSEERKENATTNERRLGLGLAFFETFFFFLSFLLLSHLLSRQ